MNRCLICCRCIQRFLTGWLIVDDKTWCWENENYPQCNWRQFIRLRAAFSGATKDFILPIFHICSSTLSMIPCSGTNTSNFYSALWKKLEENKRQRELPRKKVVQKVVQVWWRREEGADCQLQHGQEVSFNKQLFKYLCWILLVKKIWFFFLVIV